MGSTLKPKIDEVENHIVSTLTSTLPKLPHFIATSRADDILRHPDEHDLFKKLGGIAEAPLEEFDPGVFSEELLNLGICGTVDMGKEDTQGAFHYLKGNIREGTYAGTQAAMTQIYSRIEQSYASYFDALAIEPTLPRYIDLKEKREMYQYSAYPKDEHGNPATYPPHLQTIPKEDDVSKWKIFNALGLAESIIVLKKVIPDTFLGKTADWILDKVRTLADGTPQEGPTIQDCEEYNKFHRKSGTDIARGDNIGLLPDWYSDRRFAEQCFTGTNPMTITQATKPFIEEFTKAAKDNNYEKWAEELPKIDSNSLFMQDCSYFREAAGVGLETILQHKEEASDENWSCAPVTLFQLHDDGKLHPIAICIDYKKTMDSSVTIFNKRMSPSDAPESEATDWPWRYAKTCAQTADWLRHELAVHLTNSHFIEETVIVATNRTIPMEHIIYRTLHPHWYKTLSLNAAARDSLVPHTIRDLVGISPEQTSSFVRHAYENFNFVDNYVPNQLQSRGFPSDEEALSNPRYKNYAYARNVTSMWSAVRQYVDSILRTHYDDEDQAKADAKIAGDEHISDWCREVQIAGHLPTFPTIQTLEQLVDAVTMCIHIAAPQHTAVNYLQNFYQAFVPAKPPSLCAAPPTSHAELIAYDERALTRALPIGRQRSWLLATQIPWLLSFRVASDRSLLNFALSQWSVYRRKRGTREVAIRDISETFYSELCRLARVFYANSRAMDDGAIPYMVMDPSFTAVSILI